jgi:hypothetical protein
VLKRYWRPYTPAAPSSADLQTEAQAFMEDSQVTESLGNAQSLLPVRDNSDENVSEGDLYKLFDFWETRLYSYEDITIGNTVDTTLDGIRHGVLPEPLKADKSNTLDKGEIIVIGMKRRYRQEEDVDAEPLLHRKSTHTAPVPRLVIPNHRDVLEPTPRAHAQVLLPNPGWVIRNFRSLKELLVTLLGAVKGVQNLLVRFPRINGILDHQHFFNKGGLHRDVSSGNILIVPVNGDVEMTEGRLIDLDHAKQTKNFCTHSLPEPDDVSIQIAQLSMKRRDVLVKPDVLRGAAAYRGEQAGAYLEDVIQTRVRYLGLTAGQGEYSCADLNWNDQVSVPAFEHPFCSNRMDLKGFPETAVRGPYS